MEDTTDKELEELRKRRLQELMGTKEGKNSGEGMSKFPGKPVHVTDKNFKELVTQYPFVVVDCWAPWCSPCRMIAPIVEELAGDYKGKIVFAKLNVDENPRTATAFQTMSIPTLLIFKNNKLVDRIVGALPRSMIEQKLMMHLHSGR